MMSFAVLQHLLVQQLFRIQFSFNLVSISISMACPVLIADVRVLAGEGPPVLTSPTIQLGMWTAAFSAMASFLSALGLGEIEASSLAAWLHEAVGMGTILLGGHRNGDHLLLREVSHPVLASVALTDRLQELQHLLESLKAPTVYLIVQSSEDKGIILQSQLSGTMSLFEHINTMGFSFAAPLFTAFLASVEQAISDIQMQSAMHPESAGFIFDSAGFASSSGDPH